MNLEEAIKIVSELPREDSLAASELGGAITTLATNQQTEIHADLLTRLCQATERQADALANISARLDKLIVVSANNEAFLRVLSDT